MTPTRSFTLRIRAALLAAVLTTSLMAAEGGIRGHVYSGSTDTPVANTPVALQQTGATTMTAADGSYAFHNIAPGMYDVLLKDEGGREIRNSVTVGSGQTATLDANFADSSILLGKYQVTADYMRPDIARIKEQNAPNLVSIITAADMRKLPDVNAAEAVRRLPGISLETDTGEGRYVNIRGLDADLNSTTFGGVRLPPTNIATPLGGGRAVAMDAIPAGVISSITVTKTNRPDQDAEALGGTIEITPKVIPSNGRPFIEGHLGTGTEPLRRTGIFDGELTFGGRLGNPTGDQGSSTGYANRPFSLLASVTQYNDGRGIDDAEASFQDAQSAGVPDKAFQSFEQRYYRYHRHRFGYAGEIGFQPNDQHGWYFRYNQFGYTEFVNRNRLILDNLDNGSGETDAGGTALPAFQLDPQAPNAIIAPAATYKKTLRDDEEHTRSRVVVLGGKDDFESFMADYHLSFSEGTFHKPHDYNSTFKNPTTGALEYDNTTDPNFPTYRVLSGPNPADPAGYVLTKFTNSTQDDQDREWGSGVNITVPIRTQTADDQVKFGGGMRLRDRKLGITTQNFSGVPAADLNSFLSGSNVVFYRDHYQNGPNINDIAIRNLYFGNPAAFPALPSLDLANGLIGHESDKENVYAGYGEYEFTIGKAHVLAGARVEHTHAVYRANQVATDPDGNLLGVLPISQTTNYNDVFPTLQLKYLIQRNLVARLSYSTAIARPGFNQVTAATSINPGADTVQQGNPNLKPTTGQNFDAAVEYYLPHGGIASVGLFDKEFRNYIANRIENGVVFPNNGLFAGFTGPARVITFLNLPSARARGFELNYQQQFSSLPGFFRGLGVSGNYSYVDSSAQIRPGESSVLPSSSKNVYNASVFYDAYGVNVTVAASFVGKNIFGVGGSAATDTWSQDRFSLDFGTTYAISAHFSYYLNVKNLTNTALKFTEGAATTKVTQREFYGATVQTGVRFSF